MAQFQILLLLLVSLLIPAVTATDGGSAPSISPSATIFEAPTHTYPPALFATILSTLGFQELSTATVTANLSATTPLTIFAPSDASLLTCPSCSLPLLLQELSIPGLYPLHFLLTLTFGTKIETIAPNRCLTVTGNAKDKVFVNGVEITSHDVLNNGLIVIHGLQGFLSHLSPLSCNVERMTSLSFPSPSDISTSFPSSQAIMRLMLKDAIIRLHATGFSVVSLAMRVKYAELLELKSMTIFALDDTAIFSGGGYAYLSSFRFHVVPNWRLVAAELVRLPPATSLRTMDAGNNLVVTTAGGGWALSPMKINYVKIATIDLLHNTRIVVHGISMPFPLMHHHQPFNIEETTSADIQRSRCDHVDWVRGICVVASEAPVGPPSTVDFEVQEVLNQRSLGSTTEIREIFQGHADTMEQFKPSRLCRHKLMALNATKIFPLLNGVFQDDDSLKMGLLLLTLLLCIIAMIHIRQYLRSPKTPKKIDHSLDIPDDCLCQVFDLLNIEDRKRCSLVCHRWLHVEGHSRRHLTINASSGVTTHLEPIFRRFDAVTKIQLRCAIRIQSINNATLEMILVQYRNITCLKIQGCREISDKGILAVARTCTFLRKFSCKSCTFGAEGLNSLLNGCNLEKLTIRQLTDEFAPETIGPGVAATSLKSLTIELCNGQRFTPLLFGSNNLETLKILECTGDWDDILEKINGRSITKVHLRNLPITDLGLMAITRWVDLKHLYLEYASDAYYFEAMSPIMRSCKLLDLVLVNGERLLLEGEYE